jgi:isoleucyl-tRNA synthetase
VPAGDDLFRLPDVPQAAAAFRAAEGEKCQRCWKIRPEVGTHARHRMLCLRCADAVDHAGAG